MKESHLSYHFCIILAASAFFFRLIDVGKRRGRSDVSFEGQRCVGSAWNKCSDYHSPRLLKKLPRSNNRLWGRRRAAHGHGGRGGACRRAGQRDGSALAGSAALPDPGGCNAEHEFGPAMQKQIPLQRMEASGPVADVVCPV